MLSAGKVYRKEDIIGQSHSLSSIRCNPELSGNDSGIYNVWLWKGGKNCGHFFRRKIYFYKLGVATGKKIQDATDIVGTVEARSRGFYPKPNDSRVNKIPYNMPNRGGKK